jgi:hypothetical protein
MPRPEQRRRLQQRADQQGEAPFTHQNADEASFRQARTQRTPQRAEDAYPAHIEAQQRVRRRAQHEEQQQRAFKSNSFGGGAQGMNAPYVFRQTHRVSPYHSKQKP